MVKVKDQDKLPQPNDQDFPLRHCKVRDENDCWFIYTYAVRNNTKEVYVLETLGRLGVLDSINLFKRLHIFSKKSDPSVLSVNGKAPNL